MTRSASPMGYLAENFGDLQDNAPALIVNPAAHPLAVLAWCWGEVESLSETAQVLGYCAAQPGGAEEVGEAVEAVFSHRLVPLSRVMGDAVAALMRGDACMANAGRVLPLRTGGAA